MNNREYSDHILQAAIGEILTARAPLHNVGWAGVNSKPATLGVPQYDIGHTFRVERVSLEEGYLHCLDEDAFMVLFGRVDMANLSRATAAVDGGGVKGQADE